MQQMMHKCCVLLGKKFGSFDRGFVAGYSLLGLVWYIQGAYGCFEIEISESVFSEMHSLSEVLGQNFPESTPV